MNYSSSDTNVTFGKPKKKNFRPRVRLEATEDETNKSKSNLNFDDEVEQEPEILELKPKNSSIVSKPKNIPSLSFEDEQNEGEWEAFKLNKLRQKKKKKESLFDSSSTLERKAEPSESDNLYSKESLEQLKKENELQFVLKPLSKQEQNFFEEENRLMQYMDATALVSDSRPESKILDDHLPSSTPQSSIISVVEDEENDFSRRKEIEAARALRQRLQNRNALINTESEMNDKIYEESRNFDENFASFEESKYSIHQPSKPVSNQFKQSSLSSSLLLLNESENMMDLDDHKQNQRQNTFSNETRYDSDNDDDEYDERAALGLEDEWDGKYRLKDAVQTPKYESFDFDKKQVSSNKNKSTPSSLLLLNEEENEDDLAWEMERIKRSGIKKSSTSSLSFDPSARSSYKQQETDDIELSRVIPSRNVEPVSVDEIMRQINKDLQTMNSTLNQHQHRLENIKSSKQDRSNALNNADESFNKATEDLHYFEEIKTYVLDLIDCMDSKLEDIGKIEHVYFEARIKKTQKTKKSIQKAYQDEYQRCKKAAQTKTENETFWSQLRSKHRKRRQYQQLINKMDIDNENIVIGSIDKAESKIEDKFKVEEEEGFSSDEETFDDHTEAEFYQNLDIIKKDASKVFEDTFDEFWNLKLILNRFLDFKQKYSISYGHAHVSASLCTLLSPLIRMELACWNPLEEPKWYENVWFSHLDNFIASNEGQNADPNMNANQGQNADPDINLIPEIVSKVIIPKINDCINYTWIINSSSQTKILQELIGDLRHFVNAKQVSDLLVQVHLNIQGALLYLDLPTEKDPQSEEMANYGRIAYARSLKLLKIVLAWKLYFSKQAVQKLVWESLINSKIVPYLKSISELKTCWKSIGLLVDTLGEEITETSIAQTNQSEALLMEFVSKKQQEAFGHFECHSLAEDVQNKILNIRSKKNTSNSNSQ